MAFLKKTFGLVSFLALLLALNTTATASPLSDTLANHGIQGVSPAVAASDFRLPTLQGSQIQLSDTAGRWVLLTFFATWCGPCMHEMPTLQKLHEQEHGNGIDLLAISTDDSQGPVRSMARKMGITFPILMDSEGKVSRAYKASSIPVSFLISPLGQVVGIARGARDWSKMGNLVAALVENHPIDENPSATYTASAQGVELPTIFNPPSASVSFSTEIHTVGEPLFIDVPITWSGNFSEYLLHPPSIAVPEGVTQSSMTAMTTSQAGSKIVTYRFTFELSEPGQYSFDPIELMYTPRGEEEPIRERVTGPTIQVQSAWAKTRTLWPLALVALLIVLVACGAVYFKRKSRHVPHVSQPAQYKAAAEKLENARRARLLGDIAAYLEGLSGAMSDLGDGLFTEQKSTLDALQEQVRYGGQNVDSPMLDLLERKVELELASRRPKNEGQDSSSIEFRDGP